MKNEKNKKRLLIFASFIGIFVLFLSGCATYYGRPAYSQGYIGIGVAAPNFAFSIGNGVDAYYAPMYDTYIYGYNGYYWRWLNGGWIYASGYSGPWYPVTAGIYLPPSLIYGPPPPVMDYQPYFTWWTNYVGPWYRVNHPGWWERHHMFLRNFGTWRSHVNRGYVNRPFRHGGLPGFRGPAQQGRPGFRGPAQQGRPGFGGPQQGRPGFRGPVQQGRPGFGGPQQGRPGFRGPVQQGRPGFGGPQQGGPGFRGPAQQGRPGFGGPARKGPVRGGGGGNKKKDNNQR